MRAATTSLGELLRWRLRAERSHRHHRRYTVRRMSLPVARATTATLFADKERQQSDRRLC